MGRRRPGTLTAGPDGAIVTDDPDTVAEYRAAPTCSRLGRARPTLGTVDPLMSSAASNPAGVRRIRAVTFDALGTLIDLEPPVPVLTSTLADAGYHFDEGVVADALAEEVAHYRRRMHLGRDDAGLAALRAECGGVLARSLGPGAPPPAVATDALVASLRFRLYPDVTPTLDALGAKGVTLAVVSNWDCALPGHLARLGVAGHFAVICASAAVGYAKPDPAVFHAATRAMGIDPADVLHVGDRRVEDLMGARAAGLSALLLDRSPGAQPSGDVITTLTDVPGFVGRRPPRATGLERNA